MADKDKEERDGRSQSGRKQDEKVEIAKVNRQRGRVSTNSPSLSLALAQLSTYPRIVL